MVTETMFTDRTTTWNTLGSNINNASSVTEALQQASLDWEVTQEAVLTEAGHLIPNFKANIRSSDNSVLGIVSDRYSICQNNDAFSFIDNLIGEGLHFEKAGALQGGRRVFITAKLPDRYRLNDESTDTFIIFMNSHDGSTAITVAMTPIRIICSNQINLVLRTAKRSWSIRHIGIVGNKIHEAHATLQLAEKYMDNLSEEIDSLSQIRLTDTKVIRLIQNELAPYPDNYTEIQKKNVDKIREDMLTRYFEAPDLTILPKNGYRFIAAISDYATHSKPLRSTTSYYENLFMKTLEGHPLLDFAHQLIRTAA